MNRPYGTWGLSVGDKRLPPRPARTRVALIHAGKDRRYAEGNPSADPWHKRSLK
jgi:hypothetical protein